MPMPSWPREREDRLIELWDEGLLAREIADRLKVTLNSVLGKSYRLELPQRKPGIRPKIAA